MPLIRTVVVLGALATTIACEAAQIGLPAIALKVPSPRGNAVAFVRNHPAIDPPNQTLWLERDGQAAVKLADLPADTFWCDRIVWSDDGQRVAFVVADAIVQIFDVESANPIYSGFVGTRSWDTPPRFILRDVALSQDGSIVSFRECERSWHPVDSARQNTRGTRVEARIENCSIEPTVVALASLGHALAWP
jgi:hypothetical protein